MNVRRLDREALGQARPNSTSRYLEADPLLETRGLRAQRRTVLHHAPTPFPRIGRSLEAEARPRPEAVQGLAGLARPPVNRVWGRWPRLSIENADVGLPRSSGPQNCSGVSARSPFSCGIRLSVLAIPSARKRRSSSRSRRDRAPGCRRWRARRMSRPWSRYEHQCETERPPRTG